MFCWLDKSSDFDRSYGDCLLLSLDHPFVLGFAIGATFMAVVVVPLRILSTVQRVQHCGSDHRFFVRRMPRTPSQSS